MDVSHGLKIYPLGSKNSNFEKTREKMAANLHDDMNLTGSGPVTSGMLSLGKKNEKDKKRKVSNQENFKRLVVARDRKWSELSDIKRSHLLSLATGKEGCMTRILGYKKRHLIDLDRYDDVTSSSYVSDICMHN